MKPNDVVFLPVTVLETYEDGVETDVEYVSGDDVIPILDVWLVSEDALLARAALIRGVPISDGQGLVEVEATFTSWRTPDHQDPSKTFKQRMAVLGWASLPTQEGGTNR